MNKSKNGKNLTSIMIKRKENVEILGQFLRDPTNPLRPGPGAPTRPQYDKCAEESSRAETRTWDRSVIDGRGYRWTIRNASLCCCKDLMLWSPIKSKVRKGQSPKTKTIEGDLTFQYLFVLTFQFLSVFLRLGNILYFLVIQCF